MKKFVTNNLHRVFGLGIFTLGFILLFRGLSGQNEEPEFETYDYKDINITEFTNLYLANDLGYCVKLSDLAKDIEKKSDFGAVKNYPIRKALLVASHTWGVKFYLRPQYIYVCLTDEQPPISFQSENTEIVYATPLPIVRNLKFSKNEHMCGPNCLALISYALGKPVLVEEVAKLAGTNPYVGTTMSGLAQAAKSLGFKAKGKQMSLDVYKKIKSPVIIHLNVNKGHYVVLHSYNSNGTFSIIDGPITRLLSEEEIKKQYEGYALFVWK